jgi:hypothetical protein
MATAAVDVNAWREALGVQDWVDMLDTDGRWCLAEVTEVRGNTLAIHYLGWAPKWVESLPRDSARLALRLSKTGHLDGHTGEFDGRARVDFVRGLCPGVWLSLFFGN